MVFAKGRDYARKLPSCQENKKSRENLFFEAPINALTARRISAYLLISIQTGAEGHKGNA
jgi:hypothetical protein